LSDKHTMITENNILKELQQFLETEIKKINPKAIIVGHEKNRVTNTLCIISEGLEAEKQVIIADLNKVCLSSGSACSSGKVKPSHVLKAYGYSENQAKSAIRVSMGFLTTKKECEAFLKAYTAIIQKIIS
jgi:cysteine desulfurase